MKTLVAGLFAALVAGGTAMWMRQERLSAELRAEIAGLRHELRSARESPAAPGERPTPPPRASAAEPTAAVQLEKMSEEVATLRKAVQKLADTARTAPVANPTAAIPNNLTPVSAWKNAGRATPTTALETALWAASGGDVDTVASFVTFTDTARAKADAWFASLSESTRRQYGGPEKLLALAIAKDAEPVTGMQILGQRDLNADEVGIRIRFAYNEGDTKENSLMMRRAPEGWRLVISDALVEKTAQKLTGRK